jgi:hypothetical protein
MIDGGDHEAGISQGGCDIVMAAEPSGPAVRDHDEREPVAGDGTVLHARQRDAALACVLHGCNAGVPNRTGDKRSGCVRLDPDPSDAGRLRLAGGNEQQHRDREPEHPHAIHR